MTTVDFITELFCQVDDQIGYLPKHSQARLYPSEVVTLALLYALTGKGNRAFCRWLTKDYVPLFPNLPCPGALVWWKWQEVKPEGALEHRSSSQR